MDSKIKSIIVVASQYPAPEQMNQVFVQQLVHAIIEQGVSVTVIAPQSLTHTFCYRDGLLPKHSISQTENGNEYVVYRPYSLSFGNYNVLNKIMSWFNQWSLKRVLKKINSDVLYTHFWGSALLVYKYAHENRMPLFVACGESGDLFKREFNNISSKIIGELHLATKGVISVSSENKRLCIDNNLVEETNIEVIPNCINANAFCKKSVLEFKNKLGIKENDFVVIFVGGFIPRKGPDRVAKAITQLNDTEIKVMFIGKPFPGYDYEFNCPGIVHKGPVDHGLLPNYLNCADVFVLPTQAEGCCNAIVEALAIGLPVISSEGAFNDDILDENNSIRINPNNVDEIANAIKKLKDNPELRKKMSAYSLARHEEYSIEGRAKRILDFINKKV